MHKLKKEKPIGALIDLSALKQERIILEERYLKIPQDNPTLEVGPCCFHHLIICHNILVFWVLR